MTLKLNKSNLFKAPVGPLVLVIADGVGVADDAESNAVTRASTPTLDAFEKEPLFRTLLAHGTHVGLPSDSDIGNSEVGHNAMGAGRVFDQGAKLVNKALASGDLFKTALWQELIEQAKGNCLHLIGLHSDGRVHSDTAHTYGLLEAAADAGLNKVRLHVLLDGRDTPERSALSYLQTTEEFLAQLTAKYAAQGFEIDYAVASGGGRMKLTMDRYEADWPMVERGFNCHTHGQGRKFASAAEAVETYYEETELGDQNLPEFVVADSNGEPVGVMANGDVVVLTNFRGDRALQISQAYEDQDFNAFDRGEMPELHYYGLLQYDGDLAIPEKYLVAPPAIDRTISEYLCAEGIRSFAISETQKFGHVTYFWNGNKTGYVDESLELFAEIPSDDDDFDSAPKMKAASITDDLISKVQSGAFDFLRVNYPNGDMVGHTGNLPATIAGMEEIDAQMERLLQAVNKANGILIYTADHGNADVMYKEVAGKREPVTSHTVNPVPFVATGAGMPRGVKLTEVEQASLANLAATVLNLMGFDAPDDYEPSLIRVGE